jgi:hypothetical protein
MLQFLMHYQSWKSLSDIQEAENIERDLIIRLGRKPTKKDFNDADLYHVWMALYRYRKKLQDNKFQDGFEKEYLLAIRQEIIKGKNRKFIKMIFKDIVLTLGPDKVDMLFDAIWKEHFDKRWQKYERAKKRN